MPKRRRGSDPIHDLIVIETADGVRLRCSIAALGRETEPRWMVMDEDGAQFVGPVVTSERDADAVTRLIQDWWATTRTSEPPEARTDAVPSDDGAVADEHDRTEGNRGATHNDA
jgi:hypothetical protein